jgi:hypothetical protein
MIYLINLNKDDYAIKKMHDRERLLTMDYRVLPLEGVGVVKFGMTPDEARRYI